MTVDKALYGNFKDLDSLPGTMARDSWSSRFPCFIKECHPPSSFVPNLPRHELETTLGGHRGNFRAIRARSPFFWSVGRNEGDVSCGLGVGTFCSRSVRLRKNDCSYLFGALTCGLYTVAEPEFSWARPVRCCLCARRRLLW